MLREAPVTIAAFPASGWLVVLILSYKLPFDILSSFQVVPRIRCLGLNQTSERPAVSPQQKQRKRAD